MFGIPWRAESRDSHVFAETAAAKGHGLLSLHRPSLGTPASVRSAGDSPDMLRALGTRRTCIPAANGQLAMRRESLLHCKWRCDGLVSTHRVNA